MDSLNEGQTSPPDFNQMEEMRCPDCKRTLGAIVETSDEPNVVKIRLECGCGRIHALPPRFVIDGIIGPQGVLTIYTPRE
jgi:hypothetical protein